MADRPAAMCMRHPQVRLTTVDQPPVHWSFCGRCEAEKVRAFIDSVRDPNLKDRLESALTGRVR